MPHIVEAAVEPRSPWSPLCFAAVAQGRASLDRGGRGLAAAPPSGRLVRTLHHLAEHALAFHLSPHLHHHRELARQREAARTAAPQALAASTAGNPWLVLVVMCLGFFMILLDTTIVNIAVPSILRDMHASLDQILWVLNAYILLYAGLLIPAGRLGELLGQRTLFWVGIVVFVIASAACGLAQTPTELLIGRAVQGVGGALLTPQTMALLTEVFPVRSRSVALGIWGAIAGVAVAVGPLLGGLIVTYIGWRWIFYINLPLGLLAIAGAFIFVPNLKPSIDHKIDVPGVLIATAGMTLVVFSLTEAERYRSGAFLGPITIPETLAAGILLLIAFVLWERFHPQPLIPTILFTTRDFAIASLIGALLGFGLVAFFFVFTLYLQTVLSLSALTAGLVIAPLPLTAMFVAPIAGHVADRVGGKWPLILGLFLFASGLGVVGLLSRVDSNPLTLVPALVLAGAGMGMTFAPLAGLAIHDVRIEMAGVASGVMNTTRQAGSVIGAAVVGAVLQAQLTTAFHEEALKRTAQLAPDLRSQVLATFGGDSGLSFARPAAAGSGEGARQIADVVHQVFANGFVDAMRTPILLGASALLIGALAALFFKSRVAEEASGGPASEVA